MQKLPFLTNANGIEEIIEFLNALMESEPNDAVDLLDNYGDDVLARAKKTYKKMKTQERTCNSRKEK